MHELRAFQQTFGRALLDGSGDTAVTIHRNTVMKGWIDALRANYPTIVQLVGDEWFNACAFEYAHRHPARSPVLALYGEQFPAFLDTFEPAAELPYLPDVARIDRLWVEAHTAADPVERFARVRHSAATIWIHHRTAAASSLTVDQSDEAILLTRPRGAVEYTLCKA
jgi:hypothetical protein